MPLPPERLAAAARRALELAWARAGATAPNPPVGCVLLGADGEVLAEGAHVRAGEAHAEAAALAILRSRGRLAELRAAVVTLEPCSHFGRTPPCADALLETPMELLVYGAPDPHPRAPGEGLRRVAAAGRAILAFAALEDPAADPLARSAARLIEPFARSSRGGRPFVTVKTALTANGSMRPPPGRTTFTSEASLARAHLLRRQADALLTGSGTILADNPRFTVRRVADHPGKRRILALLDRRGRVPDGWLEAARARGLDPRRFEDPAEALDALGAAGVLEVLVEAGPTLRTTMLERGLWDEEVVFQRAAGGGPDRVRIRRRDGAEAFGLFESSPLTEATCP